MGADVHPASDTAPAATASPRVNSRLLKMCSTSPHVVLLAIHSRGHQWRLNVINRSKVSWPKEFGT
jgi:hypothetical protein